MHTLITLSDTVLKDFLKTFLFLYFFFLLFSKSDSGTIPADWFHFHTVFTRQGNVLKEFKTEWLKSEPYISG